MFFPARDGDIYKSTVFRPSLAYAYTVLFDVFLGVVVMARVEFSDAAVGGVVRCRLSRWSTFPGNYRQL